MNVFNDSITFDKKVESVLEIVKSKCGIKTLAMSIRQAQDPQEATLVMKKAFHQMANSVSDGNVKEDIRFESRLMSFFIGFVVDPNLE